MTAPAVGEAAPAISLIDQHGRHVTLADFAGTPLLLVFVPFAFSDTCTNELIELRDAGPLSEDKEVAVAIVSCDSLYTMKAWGDAHAFDQSLLSDFWPHGEAARAYGVFSEDKGLATRGTFLIDGEGTVRWRVLNPTGEARAIDDYREAIAQLV
ncbi:redoxin domain-containing protein [Demequina sp. NBRC 110057]|uniref:redoxin domain-containing protein n=1 Tax=Demequina sp. NBRC 110057 TaxID=1570346 RepID=UPI001F3D2E85|nr:redoxin domain-containing protein [Demequina sp. NBRC 110057]